MSDLKNEPPAYASPILVEDNGIRQVITMTGSAAVGIEADTGKLLWRYAHRNQYGETCLTPLYHDGHVFISSGYNKGCELLKLTFEDKAVKTERVWMNKKADFLFGGAILWNGYIYAAGDYQPGWFCLDWKTGEIKYRQKDTKDGAITCADGMLYCLTPEGVMRLVEPTPDQYKVVSEFAFPKRGRQQYFAHPVVCDGRLYVRHEDRRYCYSITAEK